MMIIAQLQNVEAEFVKSFLLVVSGLLSGAGVVFGMLRRKRTIDPQPFEVKAATQHPTVEMWQGKNAEVGRRLDGHDMEIESLWNTLRSENTAIRAEMNRWFADAERALGRIEGKLDELAKR